MELPRRSVVLSEHTPSADGVIEEDLGTDPISHLSLRIACLNDTANTKATLANILGAVEKFEVAYLGSPFISVNGSDLYAISSAIVRHEPYQINEINTDNAVRAVIMNVPFGRKLYDPKECYPETKKGDLRVKITVDIDDTNYDGLILHLEQTELPGATPERYLRYCEKVITQAATGEKDISLPRGNQIAAIMFYAATIPVDTTWTCTLEYFSLKLNEEEKGYVDTYWENLHADFQHRLAPPVAWAEAKALYDTSSTYTQNDDTNALERVASDLEHYAMMDFSPNNEDDFLINSLDLRSFDVKPYFGDTGVARCIPIELKKAS